VYAAAALLRQAALEPEAAPEGSQGWTDPFSVPSGWRLGGEAAWTVHHLRVPGQDPVAVRVRGHSPRLPSASKGDPRDAQVRVGDGEMHAARLSDAGGTGWVRLEWDGVTVQLAHAAAVTGHCLGRDGDSWHIQDHDPVAAALRGGAGAHGADALTAPMPGTVTVVKAATGDEVTAGQSLLVVEAMKMEHVITAPYDGTVTELDVTTGSTVAMDQVLAVVEPHPAATSEGTEEKEAKA
jgi:acetyl-CoA/propionyl-CoA carboxylase biotin carboxyl carrier protein